jgi:hypothetical protein
VSTDDDGDGVSNDIEYGPGGKGAPLDTDRDELPDYTDIDDDNDGVRTAIEIIGGIDKDTDGDKIPNRLDDDDDGDGIPTIMEGLPSADLDRDGKPNYLDTDSDGDGVLDAKERGDENKDGVPDFLDPHYPNDTTGPGDGDGDGDGDQTDADAGTGGPMSGRSDAGSDPGLGTEQPGGGGGGSCAVTSAHGQRGTLPTWPILLGFGIIVSRALRRRQRRHEPRLGSEP